MEIEIKSGRIYKYISVEDFLLVFAFYFED